MTAEVLRGVMVDPCRRAAVRRPAAPLVLLIGASTGGPQALVALIAALAPFSAQIPICVTLHMPHDLMPVIAAHVARRCAARTHVVAAPCGLEAGTVFLAPGDRHLAIRRTGAACDLTLLPSPSSDFCQPAVDVMFESAARSFGARTLAVVLSGMGKDGLAGSRAIVAAGGEILVQDAATSAVWGMPGAVAKAGLAAAVLPPEGLAREVARRLMRVAVAR